MFGSFDFQEFLSAFIVLFAVIDIIGSIPIILNLKQKGRNVNANKATFISFALLLGFFYAGDMMLKLFQVDIASFAVAGAFVIFLMSLEMILDIEIFKNQGPIKEATLVPLVFPLLADAYATAFMVMGLDNAKAFCAKHPELEAYFICSGENGEYEIFFTEGMKKYIVHANNLK